MLFWMVLFQIHMKMLIAYLVEKAKEMDLKIKKS